VQRTNSLFARFGPASLAFAKFVPGFGLLATALAGASRTPLRTFLIFDLIGALLWSGLAVILGVTFRAAIDDVLTVLSNLGEWGLLLIIAALAAYVLVKWFQRWRFLRQLRMDRISVDELKAQMLAGRPPMIVDVRPASHRDSGYIPGAVLVDVDDAAPLSELSLADLEVVVYCACPNEASAALVARRLLERGFRKVRPLHGGIDAWIAGGHELEMPMPEAVGV
jgi:rhodanese-related sulfurtransferase